MKRINVLSLLIVVLFLSGCSSIPKDYAHTSSTAFEDHTSTTIGQVFDEEAARYPGLSGFDIIRYGRQAFTDRIAMTEMAEKSLDLQYYAWETDSTGRLLAYYVLKAADRGVKVRVLLDDIGLEGRDDMVAALDAHPNIEIRIFNPFSHRGTHDFSFLSEFDRVNHRMHNKTFVMDNALLIIGGRNIGDHYFGVDDDINFRDLDVAAAGPIVREVSHVYDYFWNGTWSVPIKALVDKTYSSEDMNKARDELKQKVANDHYPYPLAKDINQVRSQMLAIRDQLIWAPGKFVWDDPKQMKLSQDEQHGTMIQKFIEKLRNINKSVTIESPYFIARKRGVAAVKQMTDRGVKVRVLTNSMSSNDVMPAHAGYATYRKALVENGLQLYELRADAGGNNIINQEPASDTVSSGLHAKAMVFDEETVFIGSFNIDPRSAAINTEGGLYVESPKLAKKVLTYMDEGVKPENSYHVVLDKNGDLAWVTETDGKQEVYDTDPGTSGWERFKTGVIQALPIEDQL